MLTASLELVPNLAPFEYHQNLHKSGKCIMQQVDGLRMCRFHDNNLRPGLIQNLTRLVLCARADQAD